MDKQRTGGEGGGPHVEAELSRCRAEHGAQCLGIELAGTSDGAAFQLAEVGGVECDTTVFAVVFGNPQRGGFSQFLTGTCACRKYDETGCVRGPRDAAGEVHRGSGCLVVRREGERIVLDAHADECCVITLEDAAVTRLFTVVGEWLG